MKKAVLLLLGGFALWSFGSLPSTAGPVERPTIGGPVSPDGKAYVACDLPPDLRTVNVGGVDGAGLCVFSSIGHSARWQNEKRLWDIQKAMRQERGGGWPEKVEVMLAKYGPGAEYLQYLGDDPAVIELALRTGRMPAVTYNGNHMVSLIYLDQQWACVLDNNFVGANELRWHPRAEFLDLWRKGGQGWAVVLLAPRPPAPPRNIVEGGA